MTRKKKEQMEARQRARALGLARVALGAALFVAPATAGRAWVGRRRALGAEDAVLSQLAVRGLGARDVVIGVGILAALGRDGAVRGWLEAGAAADAADALGTFMHIGRLPTLWALVLFGSEIGSAALGFKLASSLD